MPDPAKLRRDAASMHACADRVLDDCDHTCPVCGGGCWRCAKVAETYRGFALDFASRALRIEQLEVP